MKRLALPLVIIAILIEGCSDETIPNELPVAADQVFTVQEHPEDGTSIGFFKAEDINQDELTYSLSNTRLGVVIGIRSGELTVTDGDLIDYEAITQLSLQVTVSDAEGSTTANLTIQIEDIDDGPLSVYEQELIPYFKYITLWQDPTTGSISATRKWVEPMKIFAEGANIASNMSVLDEAIEDFNVLFSDGFEIRTVNQQRQANTHVIFGDAASVREVWPDMYQLIRGGQFIGYALYNSNNDDEIYQGRIWVVEEGFLGIVTHEIGHILGFGHSSQCEGARSIMCSSVGVSLDALPMDEDVVRYQYHPQMAPGTSSAEIEEVLTGIFVAN